MTAATHKGKINPEDTKFPLLEEDENIIEVKSGLVSQRYSMSFGVGDYHNSEDNLPSYFKNMQPKRSKMIESKLSHDPYQRKYTEMNVIKA